MNTRTEHRYKGKRYRTTMVDKSTGKQIIWESDKVVVDNNLTWLKPIRRPANVLEPIRHWGTDVRLKMKDVDREENNQPRGDI